MEVGKKENLIVSWFTWHFIQMPGFLCSVWKNYILFGLDFFSAPLLLATLFSPWKKYQWYYPRGFSFIEYLNTFVSNMFSRVIGAMVRVVLIVCGIILQMVILIIGAVMIFLWFLLPFVLVALVIIFFKLQYGF